MQVLTPLLRPTDTVLDVGCGPGTLTIPLAGQVSHVTALDANTAMLDGLRSELAQHPHENVSILECRFPGATEDLPRHSALIAANVVPVLKDMDAFVQASRRLAARLVAVVLGAGDRSNKFFNRELRDHLGLEHSPPRTHADYFEQYRGLHERGICANVHLIAYDFDQPFTDWDDAVAFHRAHLRLETGEHDRDIEEFLRDRLSVVDGRPRLLMPKRSAVIWWEWGAQATGPA